MKQARALHAASRFSTRPRASRLSEISASFVDLYYIIVLVLLLLLVH